MTPSYNNHPVEKVMNKQSVREFASAVYDGGHANPFNSSIIVGKTRKSVFERIVPLLQDPSVVGENVASSVKLRRAKGELSINGNTVYTVGGSSRRGVDLIKGPTYGNAFFDDFASLREDVVTNVRVRMRPNSGSWDS